jgi:hypothetical protein
LEREKRRFLEERPRLRFEQGRSLLEGRPLRWERARGWRVWTRGLAERRALSTEGLRFLEEGSMRVVRERRLLRRRQVLQTDPARKMLSASRSWVLRRGLRSKE